LYGSKQRTSSLLGYNSHANLIERHKLATAPYDN
jgi:hypothetical protein